MVTKLDTFGVFWLCCCIGFWSAAVQAAEPAAPAWQPTERGVYQGLLVPQSPVSGTAHPIGELHSWVLSIRDRHGHPFVPGTITLSGGMPAHGHGLPTQPQATQHLGDGRFRIDGVLFNMPGEWVLQASVTGPDGLDTLRLALTVQPEVLATDAGGGLTPAEQATIRSLSLAALGPPADQSSNRLAELPAAIALGRRLFADPRLSADGTVSCSTCHEPALFFSDGQVRSSGLGLTQRHTPTLVGAAWRRWLYWDGRRDSLWAQALTPLETAAEMGASRVDVVRAVLSHEPYRAALGQLAPELITDAAADRAGGLPPGAGPFSDSAGKAAWTALSGDEQAWVDAVFVLVGKAIAAFETTLVPTPSRFDRFAEALAAGAENAVALLTPQEHRGLRLFIDADRGQCLRCHNGPLFTNEGFHNIGTGVPYPPASTQFDYGRGFGLQAALFNPFSCLGRFSDDRRCEQVAFARKQAQEGSMHGAFKVPTLRNVAATAPYLHDGRHETLGEVLAWYRNPPPAAESGHELQPVDWTDQEVDDLAAFLGTLTSVELP